MDIRLTPQVGITSRVIDGEGNVRACCADENDMVRTVSLPCGAITRFDWTTATTAVQYFGYTAGQLYRKVPCRGVVILPTIGGWSAKVVDTVKVVFDTMMTGAVTLPFTKLATMPTWQLANGQHAVLLKQDGTTTAYAVIASDLSIEIVSGTGDSAPVYRRGYLVPRRDAA